MVTKGVRMDMSLIRIFNRMLILVIILKRIIIDLNLIVDIEGMVINMRM